MKITIPQKNQKNVVTLKTPTKITPPKVAKVAATPKVVKTVTPPKVVKKAATPKADMGTIKTANIGDTVFAVNQIGEAVESIVIGVDFDLTATPPTMREGWFATLASDPNSGDFGRIYTYPTDLLYRSDAKKEAMRAASAIKFARAEKAKARQAKAVARSISAARGESDEIEAE